MRKQMIIPLLTLLVGCATTKPVEQTKDITAGIEVLNNQTEVIPLPVNASKNNIEMLLGKPAVIYNLGNTTNTTGTTEIWQYLLVIENKKFKRFALASEIDPQICAQSAPATVALTAAKPEQVSRKDIGAYQEIKLNLDSFIADNKKQLASLKLGMSKKDTLEIMGYASVNLGAKIISNPYKRESAENKEIFYYYSEIKVRDDIVSDDELTPLIFKDGILVGIGYTALNTQKNITANQ